MRGDHQGPSLAFQSQHVEEIIDFFNMFERVEKSFFDTLRKEGCYQNVGVRYELSNGRAAQ